LQKPKVAAPRNFRENKKQETITDSYTLNRAAEVVGEFNVRGSVPSHLYTKDAPTARRIFCRLCKTTFATQSERSRHSADRSQLARFMSTRPRLAIKRDSANEKPKCVNCPALTGVSLRHCASRPPAEIEADAH
jgi:hypothetical protein